MEILQGHESYNPANYRPAPPAPPSREMQRLAAIRVAPHQPLPVKENRDEGLYSNKHEKLLLRIEHIQEMENIRNWFNRNRTYAGQPALTVSQIVNACLDFVFDHPIPFHRLENADALEGFIRAHVGKTIVSRWKQYNEAF